MEQAEPTSEQLELQYQITYLKNELAIRNEEIGFLKSSMQELESHKNILAKNLQDSRHEGEYLTSRYKAQSKVLRKDFEELERKLERRDVELKKLKSALQQKNSEVARAASKFEQVKASREDELVQAHADQKKLSELQKTIKKLKLEVRSAEEAKLLSAQEANQTRNDMQHLKVELKESHRLNDSITKKLEAQVRKNGQLRQELEAKNNDVRELSDRYKRLEQGLSEVEYRTSSEQQQLAKSQTLIETRSLESLREQHDKIVRFYTEQIEGMNEQLRQNRQVQTESENTGRKQQEQRQKVLVDMLNNSLAYDLPYVCLIDAQKEFGEHPELHRLFDGIRFKLENIDSLKQTIEQVSKQQSEQEEKANLAALQILQLTHRLRVKEKQHEQSYQEVRRQLAEYVRDMDVEVKQLRENNRRLEEHIQLQQATKKEELSTPPAQARISCPADLLQVSYQNAEQRVKIMGMGNIIEVLLSVLAEYYHQADLTDSKLMYYRIYESFYWQLRKSTVRSIESRRTSSKSQSVLRKALISVYFVKVMECRMRLRLATYPSSTFSSVQKQVGDRRLASGLCRQSMKEERLIQNSVLDQLKREVWSSHNEIDWTMQLLKKERFISVAVLAQSSQSKGGYPDRLFSLEVARELQRVKDALAHRAQSEPIGSVILDRSEAATYSPFFDILAREPMIQSRLGVRQPSNILELKRELDQALNSGGRSEASLNPLSPRQCGSIRSLRQRLS